MNSFLQFLNCLLILWQLMLPGPGPTVHAGSPPTLTYYGPQINLDGLYNTWTGRGTNGRVDYRFRAKTSASGYSFAVRIYLAFNHLSTSCGVYSGSYAGGTGGTLLIQLETDDGTSAHLPSGTVLASYSVTNPIQCNNGTSYPNCTNSQRLFTLSPTVNLTSGTLYHIVFTDTDPSPTCNWVSVDNTRHP